MPVYLCVDHPAYTALYDYKSTDVRDLTFAAGDVIMVHEMSGAWWMGSIAGRSGMFPANYVASVCCCMRLYCAVFFV